MSALTFSVIYMNLIDFIPHATPYTFEVKNATVIWLSFVQKAAEQYLGG